MFYCEQYATNHTNQRDAANVNLAAQNNAKTQTHNSRYIYPLSHIDTSLVSPLTPFSLCGIDVPFKGLSTAGFNM